MEIDISMPRGGRIEDDNITPTDEHQHELMEHVHPPAWQHPRAFAKYDLVVLGGGTAGLVCAMGAAGLGARVALVERHRLGGDCLNTGCVPSKAIIRSARAVGELNRAAALGVYTSAISVDFASVMRRMRARRASIAEHDAAARLERAGVHVFFGHGRFADANSILVDDQRLRFRRAVIATGGRPVVPAVPGLDQTAFLTSETVFDLTARPERLSIIGSGPVGCELAQAFARLGSVVTLFGRKTRILPRDDREASAIVHRHLEVDGVRLELGATVAGIEHTRAEFVVRHRRDGGGLETDGTTTGDTLLVAAGRTPNVEGLDLAAAGIETTEHGVWVSDRLQTTNPRVFASGEVCSAFKFTHAADALSRIALQNALFYGRRKASALVIPWVTYTDPEVAHVGVSGADVDESNGRLRSISVDLVDVDRAVVDDETDGFVRVYHDRGRLRGCTIVARHAGEMIGEAVYAMTHGGTLGDLSATVHPYPTQAEALRKAGDAYRREQLTLNVRRWLERYFRWTR
jgi:pyruvate/2-oxoglutarate dehydrogenase complex dihydrolipoamide dehydrogenase (E3) component